MGNFTVSLSPMGGFTVSLSPIGGFPSSSIVEISSKIFYLKMEENARETKRAGQSINFFVNLSKIHTSFICNSWS
jgi:hypothetical protein